MLTTYQLNALADEIQPSDRVLWNILLDKTPVSITMLFRLRFPDRLDEGFDLRKKQQYLGIRLSYMNAVLEAHGLKITPGDPRHSYQLRDVAA